MQSRCCLLMLLLGASLYCQTERGNITGQVQDPSGVAVPSAEGVAVHLLTNVQAKTVSTVAGDYNLPIQPGSYRVIITAPGFKRYERENVTLATHLRCV